MAIAKDTRKSFNRKESRRVYSLFKIVGYPELTKLFIIRMHQMQRFPALQVSVLFQVLNSQFVVWRWISSAYLVQIGRLVYPRNLNWIPFNFLVSSWTTCPSMNQNAPRNEKKISTDLKSQLTLWTRHSRNSQTQNNRCLHAEHTIFKFIR